MENNTWKHKNVEITFDAGGAYFKAEFGGKHVTAPSLDAMKKKIDKKVADTFQPFEAFEYPHYYRTSEPPSLIKVESIHADTRRSRCSFVFTRNGHDCYATEFVPNTEAGKQAIDEYYKIAQHAQKEEARLKALVNAAREKIPVISIHAYMKEHGLE